ncbi:hypothetical protein NUU61_005315 [Penicillium alfredii]|uniref:Zn(2)-C6 fungal-type domain-containing protein n=1 Tax=Penicillium alfredii TaxID=1506179 RepID=A0A9W9F9K3_9EURO|nr:uncharacterized protein NUU61_005315 [Penicillium alfredii]KAJ5095959.1 hypothetical protein NUU61_005315 [Penicillium alfredii]
MNRVEKQRPSRQRPVSCQFCRSRKLRCSRQFPCVNCTSRGIPCQLYPSSPLANTDNNVTPLADSTDEDVHSRLRRLEEVVLGATSTPAPSTQAVYQPPSPSPVPPPFSRPEGPTFSSHPKRSSTADQDWLEGEISSPCSAKSLVSYGIEFRTCSIKHAVSLNFSDRNFAIRCIWLPLYEESRTIVKKYLNDITHLHHVVHVPSVYEMLDALYQDLHQRYPVKLGQVSLLLGILASTTWLWTERDMEKGVFSSVEDASRQSPTWMKTALEVLEYSRRIRSDSIEDVQTMVILCFVVFNIMGITSQARYLINMGISVSWQLCLHRIDHPRNEGLDVPPPDSLRAEIGRRVWWYLVGTDWYVLLVNTLCPAGKRRRLSCARQLSQFAGPQTGTYTANPRQIATNRPRNANDQDLHRVPWVNQPVTQPTDMSYSIQRVRWGEICREITDSVPFVEFGSDAFSYPHLREIDARICKFANEMPAFFSLNYNTSDLSETDPRNSPGIIIQRYIIHSLIHTQRCRLHLPFLSRASTEPAYDYSRQACLEAARMVIFTERQMAKESFPFAESRLKFSGILHCVGMAINILLMELCLNKGSQPDEDRQRRQEVFAAFGILDDAKQQSPFAGQLLDSFKSVFYRYTAAHDPTEGGTAYHTASSQRPFANLDHHYTTPATLDPTYTGPERSAADPTLASLDDLWQKFDAAVDPATVDWNLFFAGLDAPFLSM